MFLSKDYILSNELVEKMRIHIANISMLRKKFEHKDDLYNIRKFNNCTFINTKCRDLPNNLRQGISNNEFTDISNKLPISFVRTELGCTEKQLFQSEIVQSKETIAGKKFYVFDKAFAHFVGNSVPYILNAEEHAECEDKGYIKGSIRMSANRYFTWY